MTSGNTPPLPLTSADIREKFLCFFEAKGHRRVASSPLVPVGDSTLLFTNSGMVQFKDVFLGFDKRPYNRAVTAQRCLRAGGKHNDLENVGYTARHHTFFEMLGNFSFGDYFKEKAIPFAWELLTSPEWLNIPSRHLWVTIFGGGDLFGDGKSIPADDDAFNIWKKTLIEKDFSESDAENRIIKINTADNFWMMGETGPCGPCSEIFYNRNINATRFEGEDPEKADDCVEIWNLVFMQYNRDDSGILHSLPAPCVDTGMGLERISAVMQKVKSNYKIDLFKDLIDLDRGDQSKILDRYIDPKAMDTIASVRLSHINSENISSARVIADHIRAAAFLIADGVLPSNEGRGYVLRRIIRRAIVHGGKIAYSNFPEDWDSPLKEEHIPARATFNTSAPWLYKLMPLLAQKMGEQYPVLCEKQNSIESSIKQEEEIFSRTFLRGKMILESTLQSLVSLTPGEKQTLEFRDLGEEVTISRESKLPPKTIPGDVAFKLYDTYGFPLDALRDYAKEAGFEGVDIDGFNSLMEQQRARSRAAGKFKEGRGVVQFDGAATQFCGYDSLECEAEILAIYINGESAANACEKTQAELVLSATPFYAEGGGQVGDLGKIYKGDAHAEVVDAQRIRADVFSHHIKIEAGEFKVGDIVSCAVDAERRRNIARNHSATHLMHSALRKVLGEHVAQRGSLVAAGHLRFDFSHRASVTADELREIESIVNFQIRENCAADIKYLSYNEAIALGATALFGEKYGDVVRVVTLNPNFSIELCGGTHVARCGEIGFFQFTNEAAIAAGVRRVEAMTGEGAVVRVQEISRRMIQIADSLKSPATKIEEKINQLRDELRASHKQLESLQRGQMDSQVAALAEKAEWIGDARIVVAAIDDADAKSLRAIAEKLRVQIAPSLIMLMGGKDGKASYIASVDEKCKSEINAREWIGVASELLGGRGGGKADFAQAGGGDIQKIPAALDAAKKWAMEKK